MADLLNLDIDNGKYTFIQDEEGHCFVNRYGELWLDKLSEGASCWLAMAYELEELRKLKKDSDQGQPSHYGCFREAFPGSPMIKEASYFLEQKEESLRDYPHEKWFEDWEPIYNCNTIGEARRKIAEKYGVTLSHIYFGEK